MRRLVDLSHPVRRGPVTHLALSSPVRNTGTCLDSPFHRFAEGGDLASLSLASVADLPIIVVRVLSRRAVDAEALDRRLGGLPLDGHAVLLHTGGDKGWGTPEYADGAPYLTAAGAGWLADRRPALVGIDAVDIDDLDDPSRPAHTRLLGDGVLVLEHLTGLAEVPPQGARLHAAPPAWHEMGTWPVRAYAVLADGDA